MNYFSNEIILSINIDKWHIKISTDYLSFVICYVGNYILLFKKII